MRSLRSSKQCRNDRVAHLDLASLAPDNEAALADDAQGMIVGSRHRPAGAQLQPYHRLTIVVRQRGDRLELASLVHYAHAEMTDIGDPRHARRLEAAPFEQFGDGFESVVSPY